MADCNVKPEADQITGQFAKPPTVNEAVTPQCKCVLSADVPHEFHQCKIENGCKARWKNLAYSSHERDIAQALGLE